MLSQPRWAAALATERITAFSPGQSPPPTTIPTRLLINLVRSIAPFSWKTFGYLRSRDFYGLEKPIWSFEMPFYKCTGLTCRIRGGDRPHDPVPRERALVSLSPSIGENKLAWNSPWRRGGAFAAGAAVLRASSGGVRAGGRGPTFGWP